MSICSTCFSELALYSIQCASLL